MTKEGGAGGAGRSGCSGPHVLSMQWTRAQLLLSLVGTSGCGSNMRLLCATNNLIMMISSSHIPHPPPAPPPAHVISDEPARNQVVPGRGRLSPRNSQDKEFQPRCRCRRCTGRACRCGEDPLGCCIGTAESGHRRGVALRDYQPTDPNGQRSV